MKSASSHKYVIISLRVRAVEIFLKMARRILTKLVCTTNAIISSFLIHLCHVNMTWEKYMFCCCCCSIFTSTSVKLHMCSDSDLGPCGTLSMTLYM